MLGIASNAFAVEGVEGDGSSPGLFGAIRPEVAGRMMVGTALTSSATTPGPGIAGGGAGVRAGASYFGFYAGLSYMDFFSEGSSTDGYSYSGGSSSEAGASYGVELGYGRTFLRRLTVRGLLGVGDYRVTANGEVTTCSGATPGLCTMSTMTSWHAAHDNLYLAPGVLLEVALGPVIVGVDANLIYLPSAEGAYAGSSAATFASFMGGAQLGATL